MVGICISTRDDKFWSNLAALSSTMLFYVCVLLCRMETYYVALICAAATDRCHVVRELISLETDVDIQDNVSIQDTGKWFRSIEDTVCYV